MMRIMRRHARVDVPFTVRFVGARTRGLARWLPVLVLAGLGSACGPAAPRPEAARGKVLERGEHAPDVPFARIADPDGNVLEI